MSRATYYVWFKGRHYATQGYIVGGHEQAAIARVKELDHPADYLDETYEVLGPVDPTYPLSSIVKRAFKVKQDYVAERV